ncbi:MAG: hypothetical protein IPP86_08625 [Bacteroidetes bacterium]|nr:hypothetical protein [Bacteroidota bacterium]MBL0138578.1 hypothetical protein [Bacteroidota bacterium]
MNSSKTFPSLLVIFLFCFFASPELFASKSKDLLDKGWDELFKDNDIDALRLFGEAYEEAKTEQDTENIALALLDMGICTYSVSYTDGLDYALRAMEEFKKFEKTFPAKALQGRSKCLQLISTINLRQGKYREAAAMSKEALLGFSENEDTTTYLGIIYNSLGVAYSKLNLPDSSEYFHRKALEERILTKDYRYLPVSLIRVADIEAAKGNKSESKSLYDRAFFLSDSTGNRQEEVMALLAIGKWKMHFEKNFNEAESDYLKAESIAKVLSDRSFYLNAIDHLIELKKVQGDFSGALKLSEEEAVIRDSMNSWEKQKIQKSLEIQFDVAEKERQLKLIQNENDISRLTNYLLWATIAFLLLFAGGIIYFIRKNHKRDKLLLQTKVELVKALEEQKVLREQYMQNELEYKEAQLSALTVQMLQKNELMQELREKLEADQSISKDSPLTRLVNKGQNQEKEWADFNVQFESINKNFYARIRQAYPDISPNDLKICALIKLNLSIKEMAGILNISPDSVKTARYRLRKKLQLNSEDNLTEFILKL